MSGLKYSSRSIKKLSECDKRLGRVFDLALRTGLIDISIITGSRGQKKQNNLFDLGYTKVRWPDSKHNITSVNEYSKAVDAAPWVNGKVSWDHRHCCFMAGVVLTCAATLCIKIKWGGNWDMDQEPITDQDFHDLVHFELVD